MSKVAAAVAAVIAPTPFDALMTELDTMAKAFPPAKAKKDEDDEDEDDKGGKGKEGEMKKSFTIQLADGTTAEVQDGSELLKALSDRMDLTDTNVQSTLESAVMVIKGQGAMLKSFSEQLAGQQTTITEQATLIKSLQTDVGKLSSAGAGRKTVLSVVERRTDTATAAAAKSGVPEGVTHEQFFAKAFEKQGQGKLTGTDIALAEASLNSGLAIPDNIVQRVLA
jgi:hypothetical protein